MHDINLIMLDMDGTLFTDDKRITEKTMCCLKQLKSLGIFIGIATGRPTFNVKRTIQTYKLDEIVDFVVGLNGVEVANLNRDTIDYQDQMTCDMAIEIAHKIKDTDMNMITYTPECAYARFDEPRVHRLCKNLQLPLKLYDYSEDTRTWNKVLVMRNEPYTKEECDFLLSINNNRYHGFITDVDCFEIVNANVSKASGIKAICKELGITMDEVMAFGDSGNDIDMLNAVGYGVVMANGSSEAKAVAKYETLSNEEDGIAYFIEKYIGGTL
ncbi:MAG: HAD family phosphatase [Erysipelotrichaceae bacterium]|nr:HAD family phosphatase [Erysipelotrichaceae bacterium]